MQSRKYYEGIIKYILKNNWIYEYFYFRMGVFEFLYKLILYIKIVFYDEFVYLDVVVI